MRAATGGKGCQVHLELVVENDRELGLYTSMGFEPVATEGYYALPVAPAFLC